MRKELLANVTNPPTFVRAIELIGGTKNISLVIEIERDGVLSPALYRPESGVRLTLDTRIPKPFELYHDCAYTALSLMLGWNITAETEPFSLSPDDSGVIRPYFHEAATKPHYYFESVNTSDFWLQVAIMDYLAGVVDRTSNDILFLPDGNKKIIDSGLSFVEGDHFSSQISLLRKRFLGHQIPPHLLHDIQKIKVEDLHSLAPFLYDSQEAVGWIESRQRSLLSRGVIL